MKIKYTLFVLLMALANISSAQEKRASDENEIHHCYVEEHGISVGIGIPYSFELETVGINARAYYNLTEKICFGPEASYFKKDDKTIKDVEFVGHYIFETKWVGIYPLIGINYTQETEHEHTIDAFGVVYGAGTHRNFGNFTTFIEYSRVQSALKDHVFSMGVFYRFKL